MSTPAPEGIFFAARAYQTTVRNVVLLLLLALASGCSTRRRGTALDAGPVDLAVEAARLIPFLPSHVGPFASSVAASTSISPVEPRIEAERVYKTSDGRTLSVRLITGDLRSDLVALASDEEHAFGSDTPTYWRTTSIRGFRTRIAEERPTARKSESYVQVGPNHVVEVRVFPPARTGESASLAAMLNLEGLARTGGVPGPPREPPR